MIISFFEEFPTPENLKKVDLISWPSRLFIAAKNVSEFRNLVRKIENRNIIGAVYWPIIPEQEGYWISPLVSEERLSSLFQEILQQKKGFSVMLDLELPKNTALFWRSLTFSFWKKKRMIRHFLRQASRKGIIVYTVESSHIPLRIRRFCGISFSPRYGQKRIVMYYTSFLRAYLPASVVGEKLAARARIWKRSNIIPAIGLIAHGIYRNEPTYSLSELRGELEILQKARINEVIIFRLGGLKKEYVRSLTITTQTNHE